MISPTVSPIDEVRRRVLKPLKGLFAFQEIKFPLDKKYFGKSRLWLEFRSDSTFNCIYSNGEVWFTYDYFSIRIPFTLRDVDYITGELVVDDVNGMGRAHYWNILHHINDFSVFRILANNFGSKVLLTYDDLVHSPSFVSYKYLSVQDTAQRVIAVKKEWCIGLDDPIFQEVG